MGKQRRRLSEQEREQRRRQDRERLERATAELLSSEGWRRWLGRGRCFTATASRTRC